ncbi:hypothetical protein NIES4071_81250 [Calothrix sp. NIES-4071]|nr:hypothetical protein NIES4071_81250 [Calothrix sp. NIES-4071]BAZ62394.1 hypothetical protein NIES4105_81180 [Calothrix sp. NIES-4105]
MFTTFSQLQIGNYFRIQGTSAGLVYTKAGSAECSLGALLQPIRPETEVELLNDNEVAEYFKEKFTAKLEFLTSLRKYN